MTKQNIDHVACHVDRGITYWEFRVPSEVETCDEQAQEMVERCETLFSTFGDFFIPEELEYSIHLYSAGQSLPVTVGNDDHSERIIKRIQNDTGITAEEFSESAEIDKQGDRYIPVIDFHNNNVKVRLDGGDALASKYSHTIEYRDGSPTEGSVTSSPLEISIFHSENNDSYDIDSGYVTIIAVQPHSDIWFDDSAAAANREYLSAFLERIDSEFPVEDIERFTEWYSISDLENIY